MTSTALKMANDASAEASMMNMPMKISDAASMLRRVVGKNEKPYDKEVLTKNNKIVDEWYEKVLKHIASPDGTIPAARAHPSFVTFFEGREIARYQQYKDSLVKYSEQQVRYWIKFIYTSSIGELHDAGIGVVTSAWSIITNAIRYYFADLKWKEVYSKSDDPLEWDRLANNTPSLFNGRNLPFDLSRAALQEMEEKVRTISSKPIEPK